MPKKLVEDALKIQEEIGEGIGSDRRRTAKMCPDLGRLGARIMIFKSHLAPPT